MNNQNGIFETAYLEILSTNPEIAQWEVGEETKEELR